MSAAIAEKTRHLWRGVRRAGVEGDDDGAMLLAIYVGQVTDSEQLSLSTTRLPLHSTTNHAQASPSPPPRRRTGCCARRGPPRTSSSIHPRPLRPLRLVQHNAKARMSCLRRRNPHPSVPLPVVRCPRRHPTGPVAALAPGRVRARAGPTWGRGMGHPRRARYFAGTRVRPACARPAEPHAQAAGGAASRPTQRRRPRGHVECARQQGVRDARRPLAPFRVYRECSVSTSLRLGFLCVHLPYGPSSISMERTSRSRRACRTTTS